MDDFATPSPYVTVRVTKHTPAFMKPFTLARQSPSQEMKPMLTTPSKWGQDPGNLMWESQVSSGRPATLAHTIIRVAGLDEEAWGSHV